MLTYLKQGSFVALIFAACSLLTRLIGFFILPYLLRFLTIEEVGFWEFYSLLFSLATIILSSIASSGLIRFYKLYKQDIDQQRIVVGTAVSMITGLLAVLLPIALLGISWQCPSALQQSAYITVCNVALFTCFAMVLAYLRASDQFGWYAVLFSVQNIMAMVLMLYGASAGYGVTSFFYAVFVSYLIFLPLFLHMAYRHLSYSSDIAYRLLQFAGPLLVYNVMYSLFFTIDRSFITYSGGFALLGYYGLLFKFGQMLQVVTTSMMSASPNIFFDAQHEDDHQAVLSKLMTYYCSAILITSLCAIAGSCLLIPLFLPDQYQDIRFSIPLFMAVLTTLELTRALQISFNLVFKTYFVPMLAVIGISLQAGLLYATAANSIHSICYANGTAFLMYLALTIVAVYRYVSPNLIVLSTLSLQAVLYLVSVSVMQYMVVHNASMITWSAVTMICSLLLIGVSIFPEDALVIRSYLVKGLLYAERAIYHATAWLIGFTKKYPVAQKLDQCDIPSVMPHQYSDDMHGKNIIICGIKPPPLGGVSIHIERVAAKFIRQGNSVTFFDISKHQGFLLWYWKGLIKTLRHDAIDVVYVHTPYTTMTLFEFWLITLLKRAGNYRIVFVEHNCRYLYKDSLFFNGFMCHSMRSVDHQIFMGNKTYISHVQRGLLLQKRYTIERAFLPPDVTTESEIRARYPEELRLFMAQHGPIMLTNAFRLSLMDGKDLYGIDQSLRLVLELKKEFPSLGIIIAIAEIGMADYFQSLQAFIEKNNIGAQVYFLTGQQQLWPLFKDVSLFLRPTLSDGAAVSIDEALYFNTPVIASDVCQRPENTICYLAGNFSDLYLKVARQLQTMVSIEDQTIKSTRVRYEKNITGDSRL